MVPAAGGARSLELMLWSPCAAPPSTLSIGPYQVQARRDCPRPAGPLPLVLISHGQGGTRLGHHDTATALADAGYLVASFNHPGDSYGDDAGASEPAIFASRPADVSRAITYLVEQWPERERVDAGAIGVFGFSRGGYTALALAGGVPDRERHCGSWRALLLTVCRRLGRSDAQLTARPDPRVRAIVAADPLNLFGPASFRGVGIPVQLWASALGGDGVSLADVQAIQRALPAPPAFQVVAGAGHFAFLAPCTDAFREEARRLCEDPPGFDHVRWHATLNAAVVAFFDRNLRRPAPAR
ncbi:dienelactone hydrolase [Piscinibacter sakaiensis]